MKLPLGLYLIFVFCFGIFQNDDAKKVRIVIASQGDNTIEEVQINRLDNTRVDIVKKKFKKIRLDEGTYNFKIIMSNGLEYNLVRQRLKGNQFELNLNPSLWGNNFFSEDVCFSDFGEYSSNGKPFEVTFENNTEYSIYQIDYQLEEVQLSGEYCMDDLNIMTAIEPGKDFTYKSVGKVNYGKGTFQIMGINRSNGKFCYEIIDANQIRNKGNGKFYFEFTYLNSVEY